MPPVCVAVLLCVLCTSSIVRYVNGVKSVLGAAECVCGLSVWVVWVGGCGCE
jgi:hypothetical protein